MASTNLPNKPFLVFPTLESLQQAKAIIDRTRIDIADGPRRPWHMLSRAADHLRNQMDEAVASIFAEDKESL
jgi:hypothetical protein